MQTLYASVQVNTRTKKWEWLGRGAGWARNYEVTSVSKVSETDRSALAASGSNQITLYTCVRDEREFRWCVQGVELV